MKRRCSSVLLNTQASLDGRFPPLARKRHFISHNSSRLAVSRAVRVFRGKSSEKFSRAVPKFALASVTSITPCPSPTPSPPLPFSPSLPLPSHRSLVRIVRVDLRPASQESSTEEKPLAPPTESPLRPRDPHRSRSRDAPAPPPQSVSRVPSAPSSATARFRPPPPPRKTTLGFSPRSPCGPLRPSRRRVLARRPATSQCCQIRESFSTDTP